MLGHVAVRVLRADFDVEATVRAPHSVDPSVLGVPLHQLDACGGSDSIEAALDAVSPDVVLNCVGVVKQLPQASDPVVAIAINSLFPHQLAAACDRRTVRLIHISTDCVFSGRLQPPARYVEQDDPDAQDLYGRSKLLGEVTDTTALTLRTSIIGTELERSSGLLAWLQSQAGKQIQGYRNSIFSGLTTHALVRLLAHVITHAPDLRGLYHLSAEPITKLDLVSHLNDQLGLGCSVQPVDGPTINRALDSQRFHNDTGLEVPDWTTMVAELGVTEEMQFQAGGRP
jgi:dTDP-4-dehydrorhamnose reductase